MWWGARLSVVGGRSAWVRLSLTALAVGMCVALLLVAASIGPAWSARAERGAQAQPTTLAYAGETVSAAEAAALEVHQVTVSSGPYSVLGIYLAALKPDAPLPPGIDRLPGPGELIVSPALASLLASDEGAGLRPRITGNVIGTIGEAGLVDAHDLRFYAGMATSADPVPTSDLASGWGIRIGPESMSPLTKTVLVSGVTILLVPLMLLMAMATRLGSEARHRRTAAIRLVGASARQVRRLIAGETLAASVGGLVLGALLFFAGRAAAPWISLGGRTFFPHDITPQPALAAAIVLLVPVLAVGVALAATRATINEPLAMRRLGRVKSRRLGWRLLVPAAAAGVVLVVITGQREIMSGGVGLAAAIGLTMLTIPVMVPYLVEKISRAGGGAGPTAGQLALRRLQVDAGATGRIASSIAVVLAGIIALVPLLNFAASTHDPDTDRTRFSDRTAYVQLVSVPTAALTEAPQQIAAAAPDTGPVLAEALLGFRGRNVTDMAAIADCATIMAVTTAASCRDGQVFALDTNTANLAGENLQLDRGDTSGPTEFTWQAPNVITSVQHNGSIRAASPDLFITPGALTGEAEPLRNKLGAVTLIVNGDGAAPMGAAERDAVANALAGYTWHVANNGFLADSGPSRVEQLMLTVRTGLVVGGGLLVLLATLGLIVTTIEHISDRRRALTLAVATGIPRATLARSLLLGTALPTVIAFILAVAAGLVIPLAIGPYLGRSLHPSPWSLIILPAIALAAVIAITAAALPALKNLTRPEALRTE